VQAFSSLQPVPSVLAGFEQTPVLELQVPTSWHWSLAAQTTGLLPTHTPAEHESVCVHLSPSSHEPVRTGLLHLPVWVSQVPALWHWSLGVHETALPPTHAPDWHVSDWVQALPSLQTVPSVLLGLEQAPVLLSHVPTSWHWSLALQVTGFLPTHLPAEQPSVLVQALPSSQPVPSMRGDLEQAPVSVLQTPTLQASSRFAQLTGVPDWQLKVARLHVSTPLQALPSLQSASLAQPHLLWS
jgi:hypothetical protein